MKSKIILCLALVLSGGLFGRFGTKCAYGLEAPPAQLDRTNLKTDYSFLQVNTAHIHFTNNEMVTFIVAVIPKDKHEAKHFSGVLAIRDANIKERDNSIAWTGIEARPLLTGPHIEEIPKALRAKCLVFEFTVAARYLDKSEFRLEESEGLGGSAVAYQLNLKEFADYN